MQIETCSEQFCDSWRAVNGFPVQCNTQQRTQHSKQAAGVFWFLPYMQLKGVSHTMSLDPVDLRSFGYT